MTGSDTVLLTASTVVNGQTVTVTLPIPRYSWSLPHLRSDYKLTARHRLGTEIVRTLDVTFTDDAEDGNE
jgi:hypothetical protein